MHALDLNSLQDLQKTMKVYQIDQYTCRSSFVLTYNTRICVYRSGIWQRDHVGDHRSDCCVRNSAEDLLV